MARQNELVDLSVCKHAMTAKAVLVSDKGDREKAVWLPLSQVEINTDKGEILEITVPYWLARDKGLI